MAYILGFIRRTALYGFIALIVALCTSKFKFSDLFIAPNESAGFSGMFSSLLLWCLIALPVVELLFVGYRKLSAKWGDGSNYGFEEFFTTFFRDITYPFLSFGTLMQGISDKEFISTSMGWFETIFSFVCTWGWIGFLTISILVI